MSDKNIDWLRRLQLLEKALKENRVNDSACVALDGKISGYELDFSEHDKVFEDKIASLEKRMAYMKGKNNYLRTRCMEDAIDAFDRGSYGALTIVGRRFDLEVENQELKQRIAELESKNYQLTESILRKETKIHELESKETVDLPFDPLETANYLINATWERETSSLERGILKCPEYVSDNMYRIDDLEQIAEHLLIYCKHNKESE